MPDIVLRLRIDDKDYDAKILEADQQLKKLKTDAESVSNSFDKVGVSGNKNLELIKSKMNVGQEVTKKFARELSSLATGLLWGGFIGAAFTGFAELIQGISSDTEKATAQVKKFQGAVEQLINIQTSKGSFNILAEDIPEAIETLKANIKPLMELSQNMTIEEINNRSALNAEIIETNLSMHQAIAVLEEMKKKYEELDRAKNVLTKAGLIYTLEKTKETNDEIIKDNKRVTEKYAEELKTRVIQFQTADELFNYLTNKTNQSLRDKYFERRRMEDDLAEAKQRIFNENAEAEMQSADQTFGYLSGAYQQHTAVFKAASAAQALINTYAAAQAALAPPPLGLGPILGPALAALVVAGGLARVASILSTEIPGYAQGGIVVGEKGPEVIAPMDSYAEGQSLLVAKTIAAVNGKIGTGYNMENKMNELISVFRKKNFVIKRGDLVTSIDAYRNTNLDLER